MLIGGGRGRGGEGGMFISLCHAKRISLLKLVVIRVDI